MQYLALIYGEEARWANLSPEDRERLLAAALPEGRLYQPDETADDVEDEDEASGLV